MSTIRTQDHQVVTVESWNEGDGSVLIDVAGKYGALNVVLTREEAVELAAAIEQIIAEVTA